MAPAASKRVRNTRVTRHFLIGNEACILPAPGYPSPAPEGHTKGWKVFVRPLPNGPDLGVWLKKVQFKLHHTYSEPSRMIEAPGPFEVKETGYGEFGVEIRLYFAPESGEKAVWREHYLCLAAYGGEVERARQESANLFLAERLETVEFNEPTVEFFRALVGEVQFDWVKTKRGRGKGKKAELVWEGSGELGAGLPEKGGGVGEVGSGGVWSKQYERQMVAQLKESERLVALEVEEEKGKAEERRKRLEELGGQAGAAK